MDILAERRILSVSQFTMLVRGLLEENFAHVWVSGEVSNLATPSSGHLYFTLKDAGAQLRCVMFRASARASRFRLQDGMGLLVRGRVSIYDQRGEYQLIVEYLEPQGIGALQMAFIQLKERLAKEGLFDEARKRSLPPFPRRVGVVTSATGAALHDILTVLRRRSAGVEVLVCPVKVQGEGAAAEIAAAIADLNRYGQIDVMIVGRGGGSMEDLWAFNEEVVARAIHGSKIPVISAVGHEVDFTIADFVADLRAATPSAAAELVAKSTLEMGMALSALVHRLQISIRQRLERSRSDLRGLSLALKDPLLLVGHMAQRVDDLTGRLERTVQTGMARRAERLESARNRLRILNPLLTVEREREKLAALLSRAELLLHRSLVAGREAAALQSGKLHALSPLATLARGYAVVTIVPDGRAVRDGGTLRPGDRLDIRFSRGRAVARVESADGGGNS